MQARADSDPCVVKALAILDNPRPDVPKRGKEKRTAGRIANFVFKFDAAIVAARLKYPKVFPWWVMWQSYVEANPAAPQPRASTVSRYMKEHRAQAA